MASEPVEIDSGLEARVRDITDDVPGYLEAALRRQLEDQAFNRLLDDLEAESGPVPEEVCAKAELFWHAS